MILVCELKGREQGPAFAIPDRRLALSVYYNTMFQRYLIQVQEDTSLVPEDQDVESQYSTNRTP